MRRCGYHAAMNTPALPVIRLKIERRSTHPWIFQKMVEKPDVRPKPGALVDVVDNTGVWVARGFYNGHSRITLRVLTENPDEAVDAGCFRARIAEAVCLRRESLRRDDVRSEERRVGTEGGRKVEFR